MDMIAKTLPHHEIQFSTKFSSTIHHTSRKNFDRRHFIENKGMPPPAHLLLDQIGEISSSFQPFHLLQPPVSVPMVSTILDKEIAHRTILPL